MKRQLSIPVLVLAAALSAVPVHADIKKEERSQVTFGGMLGKVFNFFGGRSAREGVVSTVAVSGDRKFMTTGENSAQIVDLNEEKVYELDLRRRTYRVTTFEQIRKQMADAAARARESAAQEQQKAGQKPQQTEGKEMEIDFDMKNTGQTKTINGFDTRQVIATVTVREKGKTLEESGGLMVTVDNWLTKTVSLKEIGDFERRYYEKVLAGTVTGVDAQQMATAMAMFPGLKEAFERIGKETFEGTAIQSTTTVQAVKSAEQVKQEAAAGASASSDDKRPPTSIGGAIGGFMRRRQQQKQAAAETTTDPSRTTLMTINNEVLKVATNVTAADVALPAGFKERN